MKTLIKNRKKTHYTWLMIQDNEERKLYTIHNRYVKLEVSKRKNLMWKVKYDVLNTYSGGTQLCEEWKTIGNLRKFNINEKYNTKIIDVNDG